MNSEEKKRMAEIKSLLIISNKEDIPLFISFNDRSEKTGVVKMIDQFFRVFFINDVGYSPKDIVEIELAGV